MTAVNDDDLGAGAADADDVLDRRALDELYEVLENDLFMIIDEFQEQLPLQLSELAGLLEREDWAAASRMAHSIKGSASNMGALRLAELAASMEKLGRADDRKGMLAAHVRIGDLAARTLAALRVFVSERSGA
jgi:histidine phosphotransfer protein HptB